MPIYQYRCTKGHDVEVMQRMSDDALTTCEVCGAEASRVLFAPAIHFKGSGFHNTDYGTRRRPASEDGAGGGSSDSGSGNGSAAGTSGGSDGASGGAAKEKKSGGKTVGLDKV